MTAGRKQKKAPEIIDAETAIDPPRVANAMVAMQQDGQSAQRDAIAEAFALGVATGSASAFSENLATRPEVLALRATIQARQLN